MSKKAFGNYFYSMENSYATKVEATRAAASIKKGGKYFVRVSGTGWGKGSHPWAVYVRSK